VPHHDPIRPDPIPTGALKRRFWRIFRLLALLSIIVAALAVVIVARGQSEVRIHLLIATGLGTGLMMLVGSALMALVFLSASSGHDEQAAPRRREEEDQ
jgi:uncharacterized BrkB/YihY/UPF0761 family membrane protein